MPAYPLCVCSVPPTRDVGSFTTNCRASVMETKEENALWDYNKAREHDGLPPLKSLPAGTTFKRKE